MSQLETYKTTISEGEDLQFPITWTEKESGNPIDLTGSQIIFESEDGTYDYNANIIDHVGGKYEFNLPASQTANTLADGSKKSLRYTVKHISSGGLSRYLFKLQVVVVGIHD